MKPKPDYYLLRETLVRIITDSAKMIDAIGPVPCDIDRPAFDYIKLYHPRLVESHQRYDREYNRLQEQQEEA